MKRIKTDILATLAVLLLPLAAAAQLPSPDSISVVRRPAPDSLALLPPQQAVRPLVRSRLNLMARAYGDSIVLRWAPEDYVSWKYLNRTGYTLLRVSDAGIDTLAHALKPISREQMLQKYSQTDSLAAIAAEVTWGEGYKRYSQTRNRPGTMGALVEMSEDQNMMFGMAVLVSEWRRDLAQDLAMRYVDTRVRRGEHYQYILQPTVWDPDSMLIFQPGFVQDIENHPYRPEPFSAAIADSIVSPTQVNLEWDMGPYSSFEIERRREGGQWQRANSLPFVPFLKEDVAQTTALFADFVHQSGTYEYRVRAHDLFGDLTDPSPTITVEMGDRMPPSMPTVTRIDIDRPADGRILARICWEKDTIEADLAGYLPLYYNRRHSGDEWQQLTAEPVSPADTMCTADVTGLPTGMLVVAAVDHSGNMSYSMPVQIRIEDMVPPPAPTSLNAQVQPDGRVTLTWHASADDVDYYQVAFANDTTHAWQFRSQAGLRDTLMHDTLATDVNQRYIYYKVRAVDYSTNEGPWSDVLQVLRPTLLPPGVAHLDTAWVDAKGINMRWVAAADELMDHHLLFRRTDGDRQWTLVARFDADSVAAQDHFIRYTDRPAYNRQHRYLYAIESVNASGLSSGLSLAYSVKYRQPSVVPCTITLSGDYVAKDGEARLAWDVEGLQTVRLADCYFSVYRQAPGDDLFRFVTTTRADEQLFADVLLRSGQRARYYVKLLTKDGRESRPSNVVEITCPPKKQ